MQIEETGIEGVKLLRPARFQDDRGFFSEIFRSDVFERHVDRNLRFVQDNLSRSLRKGTIRGLHFQEPPFEQGKLVRCMRGAIQDVAVDLRVESPAYGRHVSVTLTPEDGAWLWIPAGFAHGFCTLLSETEVLYKVTAPYSAEHDRGLAYDDPELGIAWQLDSPPVLSDKDRRHPPLRLLQNPFHHAADQGRTP